MLYQPVITGLFLTRPATPLVVKTQDGSDSGNMEHTGASYVTGGGTLQGTQYLLPMCQFVQCPARTFGRRGHGMFVTTMHDFM